MDKRILRIINKEIPEIHKCLLIDLCQVDKKNQERLLYLYHKY